MFFQNFIYQVFFPIFTEKRNFACCCCFCFLFFLRRPMVEIVDFPPSIRSVHYLHLPFRVSLRSRLRLRLRCSFPRTFLVTANSAPLRTLLFVFLFEGARLRLLFFFLKRSGFCSTFSQPLDCGWQVSITIITESL